MKIKLFRDNIKVPTKGRPDDAGYDIYLPSDLTLDPNETAVIDLGVGIQLPKGYAGQLVVRSSVSKNALLVQPPLIDENYRGEIHCVCTNVGNSMIHYNAGDRICSLVIFPVFSEELEVVDELDPSSRGEAWSGSSGK